MNSTTPPPSTTTTTTTTVPIPPIIPPSTTTDEEETWSQSSDSDQDQSRRKKTRRRTQKKPAAAVTPHPTATDDDDGDGDSDGDTVEATNESHRTILRTLVLIVLFSSAILCCIFTYLILRRDQLDDYDDQFHDMSNTVLTNSQLSATNLLGALMTMSSTTTSYALDTNVTWPFALVPNFQQRTKEIARLVGTTTDSSSSNNNDDMLVLFAPMVPRLVREQYEDWTILNEQRLLSQSTQSSSSSSQTSITPFIFRRDYSEDGTAWTPIKDDGGIDSFFAPVWETNPFTIEQVNQNLFHSPGFQEALDQVIQTKLPIISTTRNDQGVPEALFVSPVLRDFTTNNNNDDHVVALDILRISWMGFLTSALARLNVPVNLDIVIRNVCHADLNFQFQNQQVTYVGDGDDGPTDQRRTESVLEGSLLLEQFHGERCPLSIVIYGTEHFRDDYVNAQPFTYTIAVASIFFIAIMVFLSYDRDVQRQQAKVARSAKESHDLISSLFPAQFRDRLLGTSDHNKKDKKNKNKRPSRIEQSVEAHPQQITSEEPVRQGSVSESFQVNKPIAELFIQCTVMFADIAGFTAWSSQREPAEVFTLLESVYSAFDAIAKRQRIFKVETIGDCYVAVAGLPERRDDHAEAMSKFANACRRRMNQVVKKLEVILGPDTADLSMRFGLHSGPVTAGVLRGDKSRFQLFGDTVNTACRIESTGARDRIHLSEETANILIAKGKREWVSPRDTLVEVKGKGMMQTWWLVYDQTDIDDSTPNSRFDHRFKEMKDDLSEGSSVDDSDSSCSSSSSSSSSSSLDSYDIVDEKTMRLIQWNVDIMAQQLKKITAMRETNSDDQDVDDLVIEVEGDTVLDEVREIINLSTETKQYKSNPDQIDLGETVMEQLQDYIREISKLYRSNPFHSFEHASHVTQSVAKLMARVVTPDSIDYKDMCYKKQEGEDKLHEYTYGITSDPLIHFACIFSALIHDVDHSGLPNADLIRADPKLAETYKQKSVAEQNSVDLSWDMLMEPRFVNLRECIYKNKEEMDRFRQLVVNSVMATDIADKELGALRRKRWEKAFDTTTPAADTVDLKRDSVNRKATIVIEHLIQASDVSHTMQHWHVYRKWNEKLFHEMYQAFMDGKTDKDPSIAWYKGELGFFDFYIIPLAKKLKECGCFGVSSDEYLNYATANRSEWELKGWEIVRGYMMKYRHSIAAESFQNTSRHSRAETLGSQDLVKFLMAGHNQQQKGA